LANAGRGGAWPTPSQLSGDFVEFCGGPPPRSPGSADGNTHGAIHVWVGGEMGEPPTATNDPVFWLHHGNIDRVWATWQLRHQALDPSSSEYPTAFLSDRLRGADQASPFVCPAGDVSAWTPRNLINAASLALGLGYTYDKDYPLPEFAPPLASDLARVETQASEQAVSAGLGSTAVVMLPVLDHLKASSAPLSKCVARIRMKTEGFDKLFVRVYLRPHATQAAGDGSDFCEMFAPFGLVHSGPGHDGPIHFNVDVTAQLRSILAEGGSQQVALVFEPVAAGKRVPLPTSRITVEAVTLVTQLRKAR
jgi:hypothetical protein